jgi:hypothetical protein
MSRIAFTVAVSVAFHIFSGTATGFEEKMGKELLASQTSLQGLTSLRLGDSLHKPSKAKSKTAAQL